MITKAEKINLIKSVGEEIIGLDELSELFNKDRELVCYDGMEPSGRLHIAQGIMRAINTNKMVLSGFKFKLYIADWFAFLNNKLGGNLENIQIAGEYFIEVWKSSGMDLSNVEFVWSKDLIRDDKYWELVMRIASSTTLKRILRCTQIMGRNEQDKLYASQILYPCMQAADIFMLGVDVTQLGMDQRKVNMLARSVAEDLGKPKPIVVSNHMLMGLLKPDIDIKDSIARSISMKMSKSKPDSAIFMDDTREDITRKIMQAYCPEGVVELNPILEYCKYIIFEAKYLKGHEELLKDGFLVQRPEKWGGDVVYSSYEELEREYVAKKLFPLDLKNAVINYLDMLIKPVRDHFEEDVSARKLLKSLREFKITR